MKLKSICIFLSCTVMFGFCQAQKNDYYQQKGFGIKLETISTDFKEPWGMVFLPDGRMLITENRGSELFILENGIKTKVEGLPDIYERGQGGLMDLELHPQYSQNSWIYVSYSSASGTDGGNTTLMRGKLSGNKLIEQQVLFKATPETKSGVHFGGIIEFDKDNYLYLSVGERGNRDENPQSLMNHSGKIHRMTDDGKIPEDNPFINTQGAMPTIFSYGHRNPQGMALNPDTGEIWAHEHGPQGGDELNIIYKGANYGWPVITYGVNYGGAIITKEKKREGMEQPVIYWDPSIAPSGMIFVDGDIYPHWKGDILIGSLKFAYVNRCEMDGAKVVSQEKLLEGVGRLRNIKQDPAGYIYLLIEGRGIFKLIPILDEK